MKKIKCIVIDDEPLAIEVIENFSNQIPFLEIEAVFENSLEARFYLEQNTIDLVFCDIQMPKLNGLELINSLENPPIFILITAYRDYAFEGFELGVLDYLVKPVRIDRFIKAVTKVKEYIELKQNSIIQQTNDDRIFIKSEGKLIKILLKEIIYVEAQGDYLNIVLESQKHITQATLKSLEKILTVPNFIRAQRSFILNVEAIKSLNGNIVELINGKSISIAPNKKEELFILLGIK